MEKEIFTITLKGVIEYAKTLGIIVINSTKLDTYFKGDMDGLHIWTRFTDEDSDDEEELFSVLHMIGHTIQWAISEELRMLGSVLHKNPSPELLIKLQEYEYEANCYALKVMITKNTKRWNIDIGRELFLWLNRKYVEDTYLLTHFYKTGEKTHDLEVAKKSWNREGPPKELNFKEIPPFTPVQIQGTRNGLVIDF